MSKEMIDILTRRLEASQKKNPSFSLRKFADNLGVSPGALSQILKGRRNPTLQTAVKMADSLNLTPGQRSRFLKSYSEQLNERSRSIETESVNESTFKMISDWYHFAILSLSKLRSKTQSLKQVAAQLGIEDFEARQAIDRLVKLGFLVSKRPLTASTQNFRTTTEIPSSAIRKAQRQILRIATNAIERYGIDQREYQTAMIAARRSDLEQMKEDVRRFVTDFYAKYDSNDADFVYALSLQLFPLSGEREK